jgi:hypothetical protein
MQWSGRKGGTMQERGDENGKNCPMVCGEVIEMEGILFT